MAQDNRLALKYPDLLRHSDYLIKYHPYGAARALFMDRSEEVLLAGPAGTGKSLACLHKLHLVMCKYPEAKGFMARKTRVSMNNSCIATMDRHVLKEIDRVHFHKTDQAYYYPNGSMIAVVGLDEPMRIQSTEWDIGYVQEVTECTENDWEICTVRLRNWVVPYQQMLGDCNPDKPTHWMKRRCDLGKTKMLLSKHEDNPELFQQGIPTEKGAVYLGKLDRLSGPRRSRLYLGNWVAAEGVVYEGWDPEVHLINRNELPEGHETWHHYWVIDWGFIHPMCWQDWIEDPATGIMYMVAQIYRTGLLVEDLARMVLSLTQNRYVPIAIVCDHDAGDRATFERHSGYLTLPAYKVISTGIQAVQNRLKPKWPGNKPGLLIVRDNLIPFDDRDERDPTLTSAGSPTSTEEEFDGYVWDKKHNLLVNSTKDELPVDKDNHGMDDVRYIVAFFDNLGLDPEEIEGTFVEDIQGESISPY